MNIRLADFIQSLMRGAISICRASRAAACDAAGDCKVEGMSHVQCLSMHCLSHLREVATRGVVAEMSAAGALCQDN